jgi:hypothetical protein
MIVDLFSHKIHSSDDDWPEKLAELASVFYEFDGQLYNREAFEARLQRISPRASYLAKDAEGRALTQGGRLDVSKFRDEISAYPAYLGLYFLEQSPNGWVVRVGETAKRFLVREEPDVASFLRLQLPLFQYPNAMGAAYKSFTNTLRLQSNVSNRTLEFVEQRIHFSPVRLIAMALKADALLHAVSILQASVTFGEIFGLANLPEINQKVLPRTEDVASFLDSIRHGEIAIPDKYESRFHMLRHTELFELGNGNVRLRECVNDADRSQVIQQVETICSIQNQFDAFDGCHTRQEIEDVIASGRWGRYFDAVRTLPSEVVEALTSDKALESSMPLEPARVGHAQVLPEPVAEIYPFRERSTSLPPVQPYSRRREMADPELTRIKMQRRNLTHKELIDKMDAWLRRLGARPKENDHIDLFAKIPRDGSFIFEMKSGGVSILEQIRKGLSQLYEYRYRYRDTIGEPEISLCLVLPESPPIPWMEDYLVNDRDINICWFNADESPAWPESCAERMSVLAASGDSPSFP